MSEREPNDVAGEVRKLREELEKTNALLTRFFLPIFALMVILVVLEIVHR
jgi:hypothetical protein